MTEGIIVLSSIWGYNVNTTSIYWVLTTVNTTNAMISTDTLSNKVSN